MLSAQSVLFNFLRAVLVGIVAGIAFFGILFIRNYIPSESLPLLLWAQGGAVIGLVFLINLLDTNVRGWIANKSENPRTRRVVYQLVISHIITAAFFLPFLGIFTSGEISEAGFWMVILFYAVTNIMFTQMWQTLYSHNEIKNLNIYGTFGAFMIFSLILVANNSLLTSITPIALAVVIAGWFLLEFFVQTFLGVFYFGLHSFYNVSFWHFEPPTKKAEPVAPVETEATSPAETSSETEEAISE